MTKTKSMKCQRCRTETNVSIMSKFNTETICLDCKTREVKHPDYARADRMETEAVRGGNYNFPGIGAPADLYLNLAVVENRLK